MSRNPVPRHNEVAVSRQVPSTDTTGRASFGVPPRRLNRVADLFYLSVGLILHGLAFQIWDIVVGRLFMMSATGAMFAAAVFPAATLPMYTRLALGRGPMIVQTIALAAIQQPIASVLPWIWVHALAAGLTGGLRVSPPSGRGSVITAGAWAGAAGAAAFLVTSVTSLTAAQLAAGAVGSLLGGLLSGAIVLTLSPAAERLFGHVTPLTLIEALSYDHPLLRRLLTEAPGTFLHSTNVAVLADVGSRAIGADALAARVGGLYHDIGKTRTPELFAENQAIDNPYAVLTADESARVLIGHVKEGVQLVLSHGLGDQIADFVREHHGTSQMRSLIARLDDTGAEGDPTRFSYPGPTPRSRESGIVMLADRAEAVARTRRPDSRDACLALACETVDRVVEEGQLHQSGLTDRDCERIERAFAEVLFAIHHRREGYRDPETARRNVS
jgi:putative nucleotidyltransferase with HDIG domain